MAEIKPEIETFAKIKVIGVGGAGGSAINRMVKGNIRGVEFLAVNTDVQALHQSQANTKLHIGKMTSRGLGAGMDPEVGAKAAEESQNEIRELIKGSDMVFITCGLGGGTGTGASPIVANIAKESGALTIAVVTKPFEFEGPIRNDIAERGFNVLRDRVDAIVTIPNDRILQITDKKTSFVDSFKICDDVLKQGVAGIAEIITIPGLINVDFADVKTIMKDTGSALMGIGSGTGDNRAVDAARAAISSPLLELSIEGAKGILFMITGGPDMGMHEVSEAAKVITQSADPNAKVIFGANINDNMKDEIKITVIATGFNQREVRTVAQPFSAASTISSAPVQSQPSYQVPEFSSPAVEPERPMVNPITRIAKKVAKKPDVSEFNVSESDDELEIPAFIRKKMK